MSSSSEQEFEEQTDSPDEEVHSDDAELTGEDTNTEGDSEVEEDSEENTTEPNIDASSTESDEDSEGESEAGDSEVEEGSEENTTEPNIDVSSTESDEDSEAEDDEDVPKKQQNPPKAKPRIEKITEAINAKYQAHKGKRLYIRFPEKLPVDQAEFDKKVKSLSELIVAAHRPRQKSTRFCLVDFATPEDRNLALKELNKKRAQTKLVVSIPHTENEDFIKTLVEKKILQAEKKRAKYLLKKEAKKSVQGKIYTSSILVLNIPKSASAAQVKELFPDAVDLKIKAASGKFDGLSMAVVTLPSPTDAKNNVKRDLTLGGNKLIIRFKIPKKNKEQPRKGPLAPPNDTPITKKQNKTNGAVAPKEEQDSAEEPQQQLGKKRAANDDKPPKVPQKKKAKKLTDMKPMPQKQNKNPINTAADGKKQIKQGPLPQAPKGPVLKPKQNVKQKNKKPKATAH